MASLGGKKITQLRAVDLRAELEKRGLERSGLKGVLLERLEKVRNTSLTMYYRCFRFEVMGSFRQLVVLTAIKTVSRFSLLIFSFIVCLSFSTGSLSSMNRPS